ncbi:MAG: hypothetical protein ACRD0K_17835 [Egibacteraceae bacterium]
MISFAPKTPVPWGMDQEIAFLDGLGTWSEKGLEAARSMLLLSYIAALPRRINWWPGFTGMDKARLHDHATGLLRAL